MSASNYRFTLDEAQNHIVSSTYARCTLNDGVEHRLHVASRAADDAEHLTHCRLVPQGFGQLAVTRFKLLCDHP
jgi:hypothetical protein